MGDPGSVPREAIYPFLGSNELHLIRKGAKSKSKGIKLFRKSKKKKKRQGQKSSLEWDDQRCHKRQMDLNAE